MINKIQATCIVVLFAIVSNCWSQTDKNLLDISLSGGIGPGLVLGNGDLIRKKSSVSTIQPQQPRYNLYFNLEYTFLTSARFGLSARVYYQNMRVAVGAYSNYNVYTPSEGTDITRQFEYESPKFGSVGTMFLLKWTPKQSILPLGLEYTFGGGPRFYHMINKPYYGEYVDSTGSTVRGTIPQNVNTDLDNQKYNGFDFLLGVGANYALSNGHFISLSVDFTGSFIIKSSYNKNRVFYNYDDEVLEERIEELYYGRNYAYTLNRRVLFSIIALRLGYKITF